MKSRLKVRPALCVAMAILLALFAAWPAAEASGAAFEKTKLGSAAEWLPAKMILMHTPGEEIFLGVVHPAAALYEKPFSLKLAAAQHRRYIERLESEGAAVHTVVETLLKGVVDENGQAVPGPELDKLRAFAQEFLTIDASALPPHRREEQKKYKKDTIAQLSPPELVRAILLRPTVHLYETDTNTKLGATYEEAPVMNLYFCRDQMITTARGVVLCRMNSAQRAIETKIMKFVLAKLNIEPVYEVTGRGRLEGGDYFSAGDVAFIGQGLRTNAAGVEQLLKNKVFGLPRVAVVKDSWKNQEQMHLDTYFNIISPHLAVLIDMRLHRPGRPAIEGVSSRVDVYELVNGEYELRIRDRDFQDYLEKDLGYTLIPVTRKDQNLYGINFLTVRTDRILAIDGVSQEYKKAIKGHGVEATWMDFSALTGGYGAAHCTTQVLHREGI